MKGVLVGPVPDRRWPLHPRPAQWEDLETWVRRIAKIYGVSYDAFLLNALNHTGGGARDLDQAPADVIARLSAGTGISTERLLEMTTQRIMARMFPRVRELLQTVEGQAALYDVNVMASRGRRRVSAVRGF